jgi:hypothetical protein
MADIGVIGVVGVGCSSGNARMGLFGDEGMRGRGCGGLVDFELGLIGILKGESGCGGEKEGVPG